MDDDRWVEQERRAAGPCPACGAEQALPVVYGMPVPGESERLAGQVVFAGCCLPPEPARYECGACGATWGLQVRES